MTMTTRHVLMYLMTISYTSVVSYDEGDMCGTTSSSACRDVYETVFRADIENELFQVM